MRSWMMLWVGLAGCSASTQITSRPPGASVYVNGEYLGRTPVRYASSAGLPDRVHLQLYKPGYEPLDLYVDSGMSWGFGLAGEAARVSPLLIDGPWLLPLGLLYLWGWDTDDGYGFALVPEGSGEDQAQEGVQ